MFFSTKQSLAGIKAFFQIPMKVYTMNQILSSIFNSCQRNRSNSKKRRWLREHFGHLHGLSTVYGIGAGRGGGFGLPLVNLATGEAKTIQCCQPKCTNHLSATVFLHKISPRYPPPPLPHPRVVVNFLCESGYGPLIFVY